MHRNLLRVISIVFLFFIHSCIAMNFIVERGTNAKRLEALRIQQGDFLSSGTQMQIHVKLAKPLVRPTEHRLLDNRQLTTVPVRISFSFVPKNKPELIWNSGCTIHSNCFRVGL